MCVKINVLYVQCTVVHIAYIAHRAYILYMRVAQYAFYLPSQDQRILRH